MSRDLDDREKDILRQFKYETLRPVINFTIKNAINLIDVKVMQATLEPRFEKALKKLPAICKVAQFSELGTIGVAAHIISASEVNRVLTLNHPCIVTVIMALKDNLIGFAYVKRSSLPGAHDIISPNTVPLLFVADKNVNVDGNIINEEIMFVYGDDPLLNL
jgi:hypothetical protein